MADKLNDTILKNIGETIILTHTELGDMSLHDRELFVVGMTAAAEAYSSGVSLKDSLRSIRPEILKEYRKLIMRGADAMNKEITRAIELNKPVPGTNTIYTIVGLKERPTSAQIKIKGDSITLGSLPSMEAVNQFMHSGGLPKEYPFYAVVVSHANFYVLVSNEFTSEEMHGMARDFGSPSDAWKRLLIWAGPYPTTEEAERAKKELESSGETWKGAHLATMTDEDATELKKVRRSVQ